MESQAEFLPKPKLAKSQCLLGALIFGVIVLLVQPVSPWVLDILITGSIGGSVLTLMVVLFLKDPAEFSTFPTLLLVTTLFRLGLNIASTRLILSQAEAGKIIQAFGNYVIGGNYVVGLVVFALLTIINFVVITKGAGRIAEVAARFTLDALPGKQMAIDQELNAGLIKEDQARARRQVLQREIDFYGAMDGASKFVRGDAIAAIKITFVNIIGGLVVGVLQRGEPVVSALERYAVLSIGDGLVSQVPSLIFSTAAALLVTRAAAREDLSQALGSQVVLQKQPLLFTAISLFVLALMPGFPTLTLLAGAGLMMVLHQRIPEPAKVGGAGRGPGGARGAPGAEAGGGQKAVSSRAPESMESFLNVEALEIRLGYGLIPLADPGRGGDFLERLTGVRRGFAQSLGFIVPSVRLRDDLQLAMNDYRILLRGNVIGKGTVMPGMWLAMNVTDRGGKLDGIPTIEPVFNLPAFWVTDVERKNAEMEGYTVVDAASVLVTHFQEVVRRHSHQLLTRQDVQSLLDHLKQSQPALVNDLVPGQLNAGQIQRILQGLLAERVSIRNLTVILEKVSDGAALTKNTDELGEQVRRILGEEIVGPLVDDQGRVPAITLEAVLEEELAKGLRIGPVETVLNLPPALAQALNQQLGSAIAAVVPSGRSPVLLCSGALRLGLKRFYSPTYPDLVFIAYEEIPARIRILSEAVIRRSA